MKSQLIRRVDRFLLNVTLGLLCGGGVWAAAMLSSNSAPNPAPFLCAGLLGVSLWRAQ